MADEIRKKIVVDVSGAVDSLDDMKSAAESADQTFKSLGDAKKYIDRLKASLIDLDEDSEEYAKTVQQIDVVQEKLNKAMKATGTTAKNAEGSYNALSRQMSELKKAFKETNDEAEREALAKQIVKINGQLKNMDASIGNFQRNVGNYEGAFTKGLEGIAGKIGGLGGPLAAAKNGVMALSGAFKALLANPIGIVLTAIVTVLGALKKAFQGNEEASNKMKRAFSVFKPIVNAISNAFSALADIIADITQKAIPALVNGLMDAGEWVLKLANKIGMLSDEQLAAYQEYLNGERKAISDAQALTDAQINLVKKKREMTVLEAKGEYEVAKLREKASEKDKYTAAERKKFLEQAKNIETQISNAKVAIAEEEYQLAAQEAKMTANSAADNDRLAELEANVYRTKKEHLEKMISLNKKIGAAENEQNKAYKDAQKALKDLEEERIKQIQKRLELRNLEGKDLEKAQITQQYEEEKKLFEAHQQDITKLKEEYDKKIADLDKEDLKRIEETNVRATQSLMNKADRDLDVLRRQYEEEKELFEQYNKDTTLLTEEYEKKKQDIITANKEQKLKDIQDEATLQMYIVDKTVSDEWEKNQQLLEIDRQRLEDEKGIYEELLEQDDLSAEKKEEYKEKLAKINADIVANDQKAKDQQIKHIQGLVNQYAQMAQAIGNVMGQVAAIWQESIKEREKNGKISEKQAKKEFEKTKKLQIAMAIVNGLAGVAMAVATAMSLPWPMNAIVAALNSTLVAVTTAAQVQKIKSTQYESSGGGIEAAADATTAAAAAPTVDATAYSPDYQANVTGQSETENLANAVSEGTSSQRVYVVESDIQEAGKRVEVRENESTF